MDICFLGTASCTPTSTRIVSGTALRIGGFTCLVDCGEGIQVNAQRSVIRAASVGHVFITHLHGDHVFGLPGMLCLISAGKTPASPPVHIFGPQGTRTLVRACVSLSASQLHKFCVHELLDIPQTHNHPSPAPPQVDFPAATPFGEINELERDISPNTDGSWDLGFAGDGTLSVFAVPLQHTLPCVGYVFQEADRPGKLDSNLVKPHLQRNAKAIVEQGLAPSAMALMKTIKDLAPGATFQLPDGTVIERDKVVGPDQPGRKVAILGDTCQPGTQLQQIAANCDVLVHEATNAFLPGDEGTAEEVEHTTRDHGHSTPQMAARVAWSLRARKLVLTHFSPRYRGDESMESKIVMNQIVELANNELVAIAANHNTNQKIPSVVAASDLMVLAVPYTDQQS